MTMLDQLTPPSDVDNFNKIKTDIFTNLNCVNIGIIEEFDATNQTATVRLAIKTVRDIAADGTRTIVERPLLLQVPCFVLTGADSEITMGDLKEVHCIVLFNDREIDNWFNTGDVQAPRSRRRHDVADGIAIAGIYNLQNAINDYFTDGIRMRRGSSKIEITDGAINSETNAFTQTGDFDVVGETTLTGNTTVDGDLDVTGLLTIGSGGGTITLNANLEQNPGFSISAGNGATGTFTSVTVQNGIVTGGTT